MPGTLPTGVVTFLFTDIEGSTKLWERCPDEMREALAGHDAIVREIVERNGGVVFKTVGDACFCAFQVPPDAPSAAIAAQRALQEHRWPAGVGGLNVRMAVHSGVASERDGDYFGPAVNRVARLTAVAYGGQILVSAASAALVRDVLEKKAITLRDLGPGRLKDLGRPEPIFQIVAEGLRSDFPALPSLDVCPDNLPSQISSFVGRSRELEEAGAMLTQSRLLTITGPGGIGKTRLALQLAAGALERYRDGAWFVELAGARDAEFIAQTVAAALNVRELPSELIEKTLLAHLSRKTLLLVIDNVEQILAGVARLVRLVLTQCASVTIVTTSREPLHIPGESVFRLGPLADDGTRLFLERARAAAPGQTFDAELPHVAALCRKLEGIPLAIELACARLSSMPLEVLSGRLSSTLALRSKDSTASSRHRTLRDTIAWSYELLSPEERSALRALSVFRGGFGGDALRVVADHVPDVDEVAASLVDKSLLALDGAGRQERYRLLDVVREYAAERLDADEGVDAARKHAAYYAGLAPGEYSAVDDDVANVRAALDWTMSHDPAKAADFVRNLVPYWRTRGLLTEARSWTSRAIAVTTDEDGRPALLCVAASLASMQDDLTASLRSASEALSIYEAHNDPAGMARARFGVAEVAHRQGHLERAENLYHEALQGFSASGDRHGATLCFGNLGMIARQRGDLRRALELLEDAERRASDLGEQRIGGEFVIALGWVQLGLSDLTASRGLFERAFEQKSAANDRYGLCAARQGLATVALKEGRVEDAFVQFLATLDVADELRAKDYVARALHGLAAIRVLRGSNEDAVRLLGLADRLFEESGRRLRDSVAYEIAQQLLDANISQSQQSELRREGAEMDLTGTLATYRASVLHGDEPA